MHTVQSYTHTTHDTDATTTAPKRDARRPHDGPWSPVAIYPPNAARYNAL